MVSNGVVIGIAVAVFLAGIAIPLALRQELRGLFLLALVKDHYT